MDMTDLYQEKILAFARAARASTRLTHPLVSAEVKNPTCGDLVHVDLAINEDGIITAIGTQTQGCALCEAGTGLLIALAKDRPHQDIPKITAQLTAWLKKEDNALITEDQSAFIPVRDFTSRHQCVTLSFQAASKALQQL